MLARPIRKQVTRRVSAAVVMTLAGVLVAPVAFARITANTIDAVASVTDHGRQLVVTGPIACAEGERAYLRVTVTQRATGAVAEGRTVVACTGGTQQWEVRASARGKETFEEGPATAAALGRTAERGKTTDSHQWLVDIALAGKAS
jgi:hypothetical protein